MSRLIRVAICALAVGAVFAAPTSAPAVVEQSLLNGEAFGSDLAARFEFFNVSCNPQAVSHVSFRAQGEASGPYPGPFDEVGSFTIGPLTQDSPSTPGRLIGPLLSFNARFTVVSGDTVIEGVKRLEPSPFPPSTEGDPLGSAACGSFEHVTFENGTDAAGEDIRAFAYLSYHAVIREPERTAPDSGVAIFFAAKVHVTSSSAGAFDAEGFDQILLTSPELAKPLAVAPLNELLVGH
jgi:hypothetical protein